MRGLGRQLAEGKLVGLALCSALLLSSILIVSCEVSESSQSHAADNKLIQRAHSNDNQQRAALAAELNNIVQQHGLLEDNNKEMAQYIISRLMYDNLTGVGTLPSADADAAQLEVDNLLSEPRSGALELADQDADSPDAQEDLPFYSGPTGVEALKLKKLINMLRTYEAMASASNAYSPFPALPSSQTATMKRATTRLLQQQIQQRPYASNGYTRNSFDFGLGKRPDGSVGASILRFGDSLGSGAAGSMQPVSQFGKRPSAHRYDFGLGKRLASVSRPLDILCPA